MHTLGTPGRAFGPRRFFVCTSALVALLGPWGGIDALAQIPGVSAICDDRPPATGESLFTLEAAAPSVVGSDADRPASDLHCIDLFATTRGGDAAGVIELRRPWSPFGVTVTPEGRHRHELVAWLARLPDPSTLGPYTAYVAWATPLALDPVLRLGEVRNGRNELGEVALNKYLIWISAEASADVTVRDGPLIVRGRSPSSRMEAHDLLALAPAAEEGLATGIVAPDTTAPDVTTRGGAPAMPGMTRTQVVQDGTWSMPPMYENVPMLPGVMDSRPAVRPVRPTADVRSLVEARPPEVLRLPDGGTLDLTAGFVKKTVADRELVMLGFNGQIPGPLLRVDEASTIVVNFLNESPMPTAVHWHGLRLDNRFDGVPGVTQDPVRPGERFQYRIHFPDPGIYWYHPHHREDIQQELGLSGNMLVEPRAADYYNEVDREEIVMLDDLLLGSDDVVPFGEQSANYMLMGRFGNVLLANGEPEYGLEVEAGDVVRFFFTNASNTRTFNLSFRPTAARDAPPLPVKVVASDVGRFERESMVESVVLAPAERYVVEVRFPSTGAFALTNQVQGINHRQGLFLEETSVLGRIAVSGARGAEPAHAHDFEALRTHDEVVADIAHYAEHFERPPDHELVLTLEVDSLPMVIEQSMNLDWVYFNPVEWTGTMPVMNWATSGSEIEWVLRDRRTGAEN
ncbi:MAG: multicopper oxidase domain-containing protein, partial [Gemmatimonadota bacterium]|nr:multicopper oxidase domain-containing protein [Gemmatimonadota bacterium]